MGLTSILLGISGNIKSRNRVVALDICIFIQVTCNIPPNIKCTENRYATMGKKTYFFQVLSTNDELAKILAYGVLLQLLGPRKWDAAPPLYMSQKKLRHRS